MAAHRATWSWTVALECEMMELWGDSPILYDAGHPDYHKIKKKTEVLEAIAKQIGCTLNVLKRRMDSMRTVYSKNWLKPPSESPAIHRIVTGLHFLVPHMKKKDWYNSMAVVGEVVPLPDSGQQLVQGVPEEDVEGGACDDTELVDAELATNPPNPTQTIPKTADDITRRGLLRKRRLPTDYNGPTAGTSGAGDSGHGSPLTYDSDSDAAGSESATHNAPTSVSSKNIPVKRSRKADPPEDIAVKTSQNEGEHECRCLASMLRSRKHDIIPNPEIFDDVTIFTEHISRQLRKITSMKERLIVQNEVEQVLFRGLMRQWDLTEDPAGEERLTASGSVPSLSSSQSGQSGYNLRDSQPN